MLVVKKIVIDAAEEDKHSWGKTRTLMALTPKLSIKAKVIVDNN